MLQKGKVLPKFSMNYQDHVNSTQSHSSASGTKWRADPKPDSKPLLPLPIFPALPSNER